MKIRRFEWEGPVQTAAAVRRWALGESGVEVDAESIEEAFRSSENRDEWLLSMTARFDATASPPQSLRVDADEIAAAAASLDAELRGSLETAADNIRTVAEALIEDAPREIELPQGQTVTVREIPVGAAGIYAPGGRAAYPSSVLMCAIPARVAGVERLALATPPGPEGRVNPTVLAAAALCGVEEVYAVGGAQAVYALAYGTETIPSVDVIAGPGNPWVREAKWRVSKDVGIDSLAGPSELMVVLDGTANPAWTALDLCAQAEHGGDSPLIATSDQEEALTRLAEAVERSAADRPEVADAPLALVRVPAPADAIDLANAFSPEHLELLGADSVPLAGQVRTAGCVFTGPHSATAFGDYVAGSNHVLPTSGAGRFSGPLGPDTFRRRIATVEVSAEAAAKLAPHVETIAKAEGFPVHGESAMIRRESEESDR